MFHIGLVISLAAIIARCNASVGHITPFIRSVPIVRYAPFYNFPNGVRSIHAVAAPVAVAPTPLQPLARAPLIPAPAPDFSFPAPNFPAPVPVFSGPAPVFPAPAPAFPSPVPAFPAPVPAYPSPVPAYPAPAPAFPAPVFAAPSSPPIFPASGPVFTAPAPFYPGLAPVAPAPIFARGVPALPSVPFSPILRPVAVPVNKVVPFSISPYASAALTPTPIFKQYAWK